MMALEPRGRRGMRRRNFDEIFAFMSVVEAGSFVGGAKLMGLSRSAAGKAMARLEQRLGVRLLNRTTRSFSLTDEGRTFHEQCKLVIASIEQAEATIKTSSMTPTGSLRITVPDAFGRIFLLPLVSDYMAQWPEMRVEVNFTDRAIDMIDEGIDLAVRIGTTVSDSRSDTRLISRVVAEYEAVLIASPDYLGRMGEPAHPDDLVNHECLIFASSLQRHVWRLREPDGEWVRAPGRHRLRMDNGEALLFSALAGMGIAFLPTFLCGPALETGKLKRVLPNYETETAPITVIYPTKQHLSAKVRCFIDLIAAKWERVRPALRH